jgi:hypothetical protein
MTMMSGQDLVDQTSRTHLLLAHLDLVDALADSSGWLGSRHIHVVVGRDACAEAFAQAAAVTIVNLAVRASLGVSVSVQDPIARTVLGPYRGELLADVLAQLGASEPTGAPAFLLTVGDVEGSLRHPGPQLQVTWDGWVAGLRPFGLRMPERDGCILAAVAAGALGVSEAFHHFLGHLDAGWRPVSISLWDPLAPRPEEAIGPKLTHLPEEWMLVGLGHLGQAYAWCLGFLPYTAGQGSVWLVDDDYASAANVSTGILTRPSDAGPDPQLKTRIVCRWLEDAGLTTRLLECRLPESYYWEPGHPGVALIGVDNFRLRRRLSQISWPLCVDAGLGSAATSFAAMSVHSFPGQLLSFDVAAWSGTAVLPVPPPALTELEGTTTDQCGVVMLADQAVGAAFVGTIAGCLVVAEPLRRIAGGAALDAVTLSLDLPSPRGASALNRQPLRIGTAAAAIG